MSTCYPILSTYTPHSPLFPYTTLFRSLPFPHGKLAIVGVVGSAHVEKTQPEARVIWADQRIAAQHINEIAQQDRKSTRLNSSHGSISYAVFCLKKKRTKTI